MYIAHHKVNKGEKIKQISNPKENEKEQKMKNLNSLSPGAALDVTHVHYYIAICQPREIPCIIYVPPSPRPQPIPLPFLLQQMFEWWVGL